MAHIKRVGDGKYRVYWREPVFDEMGNRTGKLRQIQETLSGPSDREALKAAQRRKVEIESELDRGGSPATSTALAVKPLSYYAATYFDSLVGQLKPSKRTQDGYRAQYLNHIKPVFRDRPVSSIRIGDVKRFRAGLLTTPPIRHNQSENSQSDRNPKTVAKVLGVLRSILQTAVEDGAIDSNPATQVTVGTGSSFVPNRLTAYRTDRVLP
jgi:integrase